MVDQRSDPAFQRGFTGAVAAPRTLHLQTATPAEPPVAATEPIAAPPLPLPAAPSPAAPVTVVAEPRERPRGPNPWVVLLWVIGAGLLAIGVYGWTYSLGGYLSYSDAGMIVESDGESRDPFLFQFFGSYAGMIANLGALTLIGLVFRLAFLRDRRSASAAHTPSEG